MKTRNSNLKKLQKYFIAGIDFLIDKEENVYFIEANSNPGLIRFLEKEYEKCNPINKIIKIFNKENFLFIHTKKTFEQPDTKYKIKKLIKNKKDDIEIIENLEKTKIEKIVKKILEEKKDKIIDTPFFKIKEEFFKNNYQKIINPYLVTNLTINKFTLYTKLKPTKNFKIPLSFGFKTKKDLISLIKEKKLKKIVIKPQFGQKGENIFIIDDLKQIKNIKLRKDNWIVQEKIEVNKIKINIMISGLLLLTVNFLIVLPEFQKIQSLTFLLEEKLLL